MIKHLVLVTFSGAHATGKTTLIRDVCAVLEDRDRPVISTPSCSTTLFERIQSGQVKVRGALPADYADLDRLKLRGLFQRMLPDVLTSVVSLAMFKSRHPDDTEKVYLFVDRWFPDIYAYTLMESKSVTLHVEVSERCLCAYDDLLRTLQKHATTVSMLNVFLPVTLAPAKSTPGKFQGTCDREEWERHCLADWKKAARERDALLVVTKKSRKDRANEVLDRIGEPPVTRLSTTTAKAR